MLSGSAWWRFSTGAWVPRFASFGVVLREVMLVFGRELDHSAGLVGIAESGEDLAPDSEIGMIHVPALRALGMGEGEFAEF